jgi:hypothetical protein
VGTAKQIRDGVANRLGEGKPELEAMIEQRMKHCVGSPEEEILTCEYFSQGTLVAAMDTIVGFVRKLKGLPKEELEGFNGKKCAQCGCGFKTYLVSPDKRCPAGKW